MTTRAVLAAPLLLLGCREPVVVARGDGAGELAAALAKSGIEVVRQGDAVAVDRDDVERAVTVARAVRSEPSRDRPAVPTRAREHEESVRSLEAALERTLRALPGVTVARVHLALPPPRGPLDDPPTRATGSVLLVGRSDADRARAKAIVLGAAPAIAPGDLEITSVEEPAAPSVVLARVGPFRVAEASRGPLTAVLAAFLAAAAALAATVLRRRLA